ncbi:MAG TPA: UDP-N-acetylmuramoyl-L-alanyl-D-glutamate--2,6-diaminopimelate ligase [Gammaproteobacteria bacterium]|nr:UDP-N-acetylmuramoyl-L-alanyl-D-glutamate--2,6-diaminopimelate ligase [Gammaproteobacteria bacterium]
MISISMPLDKILEGYVVSEKIPNVEIFGLAIDSRKVKAGYLFFACHGSFVDGKTFIGDAIASGAVAIVLEVSTDQEIQALSKQYPGIPVFAMHDLRSKLGYIAAKFFGDPSSDLSLIGITGTNGKTSCAHLLAQCLDDEDHPCGVIGTLGAGLWGDIHAIQYTTPDAIDIQSRLYGMRQKQAAYVAMEVSSHGLVQGRVNACKFDVAVFTNLSREHLDYHDDMTSYGSAKLSLFTWPELTRVVVNLDDPYANTIISNTNKGVELVGITLRQALNIEGVKVISASDIRMELQGLSFQIHSPWGSARLQSRLLGDFNISNLLTTLAVAMLLDNSFKATVKKLSTAKPPIGRLETFRSTDTPLVVVDYAHTPDALEKVLLTLQQHTKGKLYVLFGCGGDRDQGKRAEMGAIAETNADVVWLTDDNPRTESSKDIISDILAGVTNPQQIHVNTDRKSAIEQIILAATSADDVVLIAGKGHEDYQIIGDKRIAFSDRDLVAKVLKEAA